MKPPLPDPKEPHSGGVPLAAVLFLVAAPMIFWAGWFRVLGWFW
jgi:hypothetical protein